MTIERLAGIQSYHAHIYFDGAEQRAEAETLRNAIAERFSVLIGRWHDREVGPHTRPMYQVAFAVEQFAQFVPWLMLNRRGLTVLVHPNTGYPKCDHLVHAAWLGEVLAVKPETLSERETEPEPPIVPNTTPGLVP